MKWNPFKKTQLTSQIIETKPDNLHYTFNTSMGKLPAGDLTRPMIIANGNNTEKFIRFDHNTNLFPQLLNQLANQSPLHGACIKMKVGAIIGGGFEIESLNEDLRARVNEYAFIKKNKLVKMSRELAHDLVIHNRMHVLVKKGGQSICRIAPEKIRRNEDGSILTYSVDWSRNNGQVTYPEYYHGCQEDSIFSYYSYSPGCDIYPLPTSNACNNLAFLDSEIGNLQRDNITNSIYPSYVVKTTAKFNSDAERNAFFQAVEQLRQPGNRGRVVAFNNENVDKLPTIDAMPTNDLPKAFIELSREIKEGICTAHQIKPILVVSSQGQLGATTEIQDAEQMFHKNYVMGAKAELEEYLNDLFQIGGLTSTIKINEYRIIDGEITKIQD